MSGSTEKSMSEEAKARIVGKSAKNKVILKAKTIISRQFSLSIKEKEEEIKKINDSIVQAHTNLHMLRYGAVSKIYAAHVASMSSAGDSLHPEIKSLVTGKRPKSSESAVKVEKPAEAKAEATVTVSPSDLPGYVAPLAKKDSTCTMAEPRGHQHKFRRRFVIGNVSKWIECDEREDSSTHKWMLYARGCREFPDISDVVKKVRFFIHQTYHPNNVIDVEHPPFHLIRRGWGEFPARVQIHFKNPLNKPVDVVHNLKLDKTYTGLQTLGAETLIDIWLKKDAEAKPDSVETEVLDENLTIAEGKDCKKRKAANGETDCKRIRLDEKLPENQQSNVTGSPINVLKVKDVKSLLRPGASLLKKLH